MHGGLKARRCLLRGPRSTTNVTFRSWSHLLFEPDRGVTLVGTQPKAH